MDRVLRGLRYTSRVVEDNEAGFIGLEMLMTNEEATTILGTIIFWDATGQFCIEMRGQEIELMFLEEWIAEAKALVRE